MSRSQRLRLPEVRNVYRLLGECRELGYDYPSWRQHMIVSLAGLLDAPVSASGAFHPPRGAGARWEASEEAAIHGRGCRDSDLVHDMLLAKSYVLDELAMESLEGSIRDGSWSREQLSHDKVWAASSLYREYFGPARIDDMVFTVVAPEARQPQWLALCRPRGLRRFTERERKLTALFIRELGPLVGTALAGPNEPQVAVLSPRLRQTLAILLEGNSEKQVASRLRLSRATIHEYIQSLYQHFHVNSRGELHAVFLRRAYPAMSAGN